MVSRAVALVGVTLVVLSAASADAHRTKVQLWFDTEDYTWAKSDDAIRDIAKLLTEEGVRGHFNTVGYLAQKLVERRRFDVIDALKPHLVGDQTLYHSRHPVLPELTDLADYDEAYRLALAEESQSFGMLKAAFGLDAVVFTAHTGPSSTHVGQDACVDLGATFIGGMGAIGQDENITDFNVWYNNMRQIPYNAPRLYLEALFPEFWDRFKVDYDYELDRYSKFGGIVLSMHPHKAERMEHWDGPNYKEGNLVEWGKWKPGTPRPEAERKLFYERLRWLIRKIKSDPRFEFVDCEELLRTQKPRVAITRADVPAIRAALAKRLWPIHEPASWCVADCFQAAVRFLRGETSFTPGKAYGFLEKPVGVTAPVRVKAADLRVAAAKISFKRHLPVSYDVGGTRIGPADFLFAALEVLETGADEVTVSPRDQLGDVRAFSPSLADFTHVGAWMYVPEFKDRYLSDRLRWQFWTLRFE